MQEKRIIIFKVIDSSIKIYGYEKSIYLEYQKPWKWRNLQKCSKTANKIPITSYFMRLRLKKVCFFAFFSSNWAANSKKGRIFAPQTHYSHSLDALLAYKKEIVLHMETRFLWLFVQRSTPRGRELSYSFPIITSVAYAEDAIRFHLCGNRHWLLILFLFHKFVVLVYCGQVECAFRRNSYLITYHS